MNEDIGWEFLNNTDDNIDFNPNADGSWGYIDEDGTGYYSGADGSWGYRNEDGTGYYSGADGSWGYRNEDGTGYYSGADGSWGYRNEDGTGYYSGADGSWGYIDAESNGSYFDSKGNIEILSNDNSPTPNYGSTIYPIQNKRTTQSIRKTSNSNSRVDINRCVSEYSQKNDEHLISDNSVCTKRIWFRKRYWGELLFSFAIFAIIIFSTIYYFVNRTMINFDFADQEIIGLYYEDAIKILSDAGFTNVVTVVYDDLEIAELDQENCVTEIKLRGSKKIADVSRYPSDSEIIVVYHVLREIDVPFSPKEFKKMDYLKAQEELEKVGFINVNLEPEYDLLLGLINKEGEIKSISIDGSEKFKAGYSYRPDIDIVIRYHSRK